MLLIDYLYGYELAREVVVCSFNYLFGEFLIIAYDDCA